MLKYFRIYTTIFIGIILILNSCNIGKIKNYEPQYGDKALNHTRHYKIGVHPLHKTEEGKTQLNIRSLVWGK